MPFSPIQHNPEYTCSLAHAFESWIFSDNVLQNLFISIAYHEKPLKTNLNFTVMKVHRFLLQVLSFENDPHTRCKSADKRAVWEGFFFGGGGVNINPVT